MIESLDVPMACSDLSVRYGRAVALDGVSFSVAAGKVYALLGRNGSGKTSLTRCLLGQQRPTSGETRLFGRNAWHGRAEAMLRVGVVPEEPDAPPQMAVAEVIGFCAALYPDWDAAGVAARLERFAIPPKARVGTLSRGQRGQLSLTLAMGPRPELLVLDDPTLGLDAVARRGFFGELVGELADRGTTVLITTHDLAGIEGIADQVGILRDGRLVVDEAMESLKGRCRRIRMGSGRLADAAVARALEALGPLGPAQEGLGTEILVGAYREDAFQALRDLGAAEAVAESLSLEDIFIGIVDAKQEARA